MAFCQEVHVQVGNAFAGIGAVVDDEAEAAGELKFFGDGAGRRVRMQCARDNGKLIISELTIGLSGDITPDSSLADLMAAATPTKTECPGGLVDAVGQQ